VSWCHHSSDVMRARYRAVRTNSVTTLYFLDWSIYLGIAPHIRVITDPFLQASVTERHECAPDRKIRREP
jgi:hypothetical protein